MLLKTLVLVSALLAGTSALESSPRLSPFGIVEGITDCGSNGTLGVVQVTDCTTLPCKLVPNSFYDFSVMFTAGVTSSNLSLHVIETVNFTVFLELPIDGEIEAGTEYELKFQMYAFPGLSGKTFPIRIYVLDSQSESLRVEICASASLEFL